MPVAKGGPPPLRQALMVGLGVVMTMGTVLFLVLTTGRLLGGGSTVGIDAGEPVFPVGNVEDLAEFVETNGEPFPFPDPSGGDTDIWLNHVGSDPDEGWYAFGFRPLSAPRDCVAEWQAGDRQFVDNCDGTVYPANGEGLPQYPVTISPEGDLSIRLDLITAPAPSTPDEDD